jgi:hypothetical protein
MVNWVIREVRKYWQYGKPRKPWKVYNYGWSDEVMIMGRRMIIAIVVALVFL